MRSLTYPHPSTAAQPRAGGPRHSFRRLASAAALGTALVAGGCTTPDGRFDAASTLGLAAGLAAVGGLAYLATQGDDDGHHHRHGGWRGGRGWGGGRYAYR